MFTYYFFNLAYTYTIFFLFGSYNIGQNFFCNRNRGLNAVNTAISCKPENTTFKFSDTCLNAACDKSKNIIANIKIVYISFLS